MGSAGILNSGTKGLTKEEMFQYIGVLLLLSINSMRSYRQAWNNKSSQILVRLLDLMSRNWFEAISAFFHVVTSDEELVNASDPLKKVRPLHNLIKTKALEHYQPLRELSVDERMVKSKARTHFQQYLPKKPIKWGFKYGWCKEADQVGVQVWVAADPIGYTLEFDLYCGCRRISPISENGLTHDIVMDLTESFQFQGYFVFFDNFYTSPTLLHSLKERGLGATGTLTTNRRGVPEMRLQTFLFHLL